MSKIFADISLSLDGFAAGPEISAKNPMGIGGAVLHRWLFGTDERSPAPEDRHISEAMFTGTGAFLMGRRTFDVGEPLWGEDGAFGRPCVVLTSRSRPDLVRGPTRFVFETNGIDAALARARTLAQGANVCVMGGPQTVEAALATGLVEELQLHLVPMLLGDGTRLFRGAALPECFEALSTTQTALATHLRFAVAGRQKSTALHPSPA